MLVSPMTDHFNTEKALYDAKPKFRRSRTCPGDISRKRKEEEGSADGFYRRCRSEGGGLPHHPISVFGRTASGVSLPPNTGSESKHFPRITSAPAGKKVRFDAAPAVIYAKQTNATTRRANPWGVTDALLRRVPRHYPILKPSSTFVGLAAETISERVSEFFRKNSFSAQYNKGDAEVQASSAHGNVELVARLWRGDNEQEVIMEVQRHKGSSPDFYRMCRDLFAAVKSGEYTMSRSPEEEMRVYDFGASPHCAEDETPSMETGNLLSAISEMIQCDFLETQELGFQALQFLVEPGKAGRNSALRVSKTILLGNTEQGARIRAHLYEVLTQGYEGGDSSGKPGRSALEEKGQRLRGHALQILANMLEAVNGDIELSKELGKQRTHEYWESLIPALVTDIDEASSSPHNALWAMRSIRNFVKLSSRGRETALSCGVLPLLADAYEYGRGRCLLLEMESLQLLSELC
uniref:Uncharacterized protein n=1 Tax=Pseudictyota dubia TaxID=2749911 RepID=A0A7R9Z5C2_9STRA